jgi:hypothetical protein
MCNRKIAESSMQILSHDLKNIHVMENAYDLLGKKQDIKLQNSHLKIVTYKINV